MLITNNKNFARPLPQRANKASDSKTKKRDSNLHIRIRLRITNDVDLCIVLPGLTIHLLSFSLLSKELTTKGEKNS